MPRFRFLLALALLVVGGFAEAEPPAVTSPSTPASSAATPLVFLLADQAFGEKPRGRVFPSVVKEDRYLLYVTATADDLVSFTIVAPRSGIYRASTRLFNQEDGGQARLIVNASADAPAVPLAPILNHGTLEFVAGKNTVTYQLGGTAPGAKVRLWELTLVPVVAGEAAPASDSASSTP